MTVTDVWDLSVGSSGVRIAVQTGQWMMGDALKLGLTLKLTGAASAAGADLSVDPAAKPYPFDGFGGNFRVYRETPVGKYVFAEEPAGPLGPDRVQGGRLGPLPTLATPSPQLIHDFELMQRIQRMGIPWVLSLWFLPERFITRTRTRSLSAPSAVRSPRTAGRNSSTSLGSYDLPEEPLWLSRTSSPSMSRTWEWNIRFTAETHRDEIKRIGAYLESRG